MLTLYHREKIEIKKEAATSSERHPLDSKTSLDISLKKTRRSTKTKSRTRNPSKRGAATAQPRLFQSDTLNMAHPHPPASNITSRLAFFFLFTSALEPSFLCQLRDSLTGGSKVTMSAVLLVFALLTVCT